MFLVCGEALFDLFLTETDGPGRLGFDAVAGGSPMNVAIGLSRQGAQAALLTGVSTDLLGRRLEAALAAEGVGTLYLQRSARPTTLSFVDLERGAPEYAFYGGGAADRALTPADLPTLGPEIAALHFGSYSIAVPPVADAFAALAAREQDRFVSLDPNVRPTVLDDPAVWRARIAALLGHADLVKASAEDLAWLFPEASPERVAEAWLAAGPEMVVVTDGAGPASAYRKAGRLTVTPPSVTVVDTVGAGDAFQAALLADLAGAGALQTGAAALSGAVLGPILTRAADVAAATCARRGADIPARR